MPRSTNNPASKQRRKKVLKRARGAFSGRHRLFQNAKETIRKGLQYAFKDRRAKKRDYRKLWITRINAACRMAGMNYSRFLNGLKEAGVEVDRKMLADLAVRDEPTFLQLIETARAALALHPNPSIKTVAKL